MKNTFIILIEAWQIFHRFFTGGRYSGRETAYFDGRKFRNTESIDHWAGDVFKWLSNRNTKPWPKWIDQDQGPTPPRSIPADEIRVTFINHATVLVQTAGINMITDPVWSKRVGPFSWVGPKRVIAPGLSLEQLPNIDFILISHDHYDHVDIPSIKAILARHKAQIICGLGVDETLRHNGIRGAKSLDWWETTALASGMSATFTPAKHFSGRGLRDQNATLWGSFVVQAPRGAIYFAGDSGYGPHFRAINEKFGKMTLSLLPIGAYEPRWFMRPYHMAPDEAVRAHIDLQSEKSLGIHFATFQLSDEGYDEPKEVLAKSLNEHQLSADAFVAVGLGDSLTIGKPLWEPSEDGLIHVTGCSDFNNIGRGLD